MHVSCKNNNVKKWKANKARCPQYHSFYFRASLLLWCSFFSRCFHTCGCGCFIFFGNENPFLFLYFCCSSMIFDHVASKYLSLSLISVWLAATSRIFEKNSFVSHLQWIFYLFCGHCERSLSVNLYALVCTKRHYSTTYIVLLRDAIDWYWAFKMAQAKCF